ncbi:hypothetical protein GGI12_006079, partial [Dipsacomyces acuminosporus]
RSDRCISKSNGGIAVGSISTNGNCSIASTGAAKATFRVAHKGAPKPRARPKVGSRARSKVAFKPSLKPKPKTTSEARSKGTTKDAGATDLIVPLNSKESCDHVLEADWTGLYGT